MRAVGGRPVKNERGGRDRSGRGAGSVKRVSGRDDVRGAVAVGRLVGGEAVSSSKLGWTRRQASYSIDPGPIARARVRRRGEGRREWRPAVVCRPAVCGLAAWEQKANKGGRCMWRACTTDEASQAVLGRGPTRPILSAGRGRAVWFLCAMPSSPSGHIYFFHRKGKKNEAGSHFPSQHCRPVCLGSRLASSGWSRRLSPSSGVKRATKQWPRTRPLPSTRRAPEKG